MAVLMLLGGLALLAPLQDGARALRSAPVRGLSAGPGASPAGEAQKLRPLPIVPLPPGGRAGRARAVLGTAKAPGFPLDKPWRSPYKMLALSEKYAFQTISAF